MLKSLPLHLGFLGLGLLLGTPVQAALRLCNQSYDVLNVAIAQPKDQSFVTNGWWRIAPNQCATLLRDRLRSQFYYIFAADVFGREALAGSIPMCIAPKRFEINGQEDCLLRGFLDARFIEIDTYQQSSWTVFVAPRPE